MTTLRDAPAANLRAAIEDLYTCSDQVLADLTAAEWAKKHGKDWTMADVPYHLAYFDRELIIAGLEAGPDLPLEAHTRSRQSDRSTNGTPACLRAARRGRRALSRSRSSAR